MRPLSNLLAGLVIAGAVGCHDEQHAPHHEIPKLIVTNPLRKDTTVTRDYVCQIRAIQHIELRALERGYLQGIYVDEGQIVKKNQRMFQVMPRLYQAELDKQLAEAQFTKIEYDNTQILADGGIVSSNELALAKAKLSKARAEVSLAQTHRGLTLVSAPFEGIMGRFYVRKGSLVDEGELLTTLSDNSTVWAYFNVSEAEYLDYKARAKDDKPEPVHLELANGRRFELPGKVETIEADFNNETGNIAFRAAFDNPKALLRHGETGKVQMTVPFKNALVIPQKATFEILDQRFVYVVDDKGGVHSRKIEIAEELSNVFVVSKGLSEKDTILVEGLRKVREGFKIEPNFEKPTAVLSKLDVHAE